MVRRLLGCASTRAGVRLTPKMARFTLLRFMDAASVMDMVDRAIPEGRIIPDRAKVVAACRCAEREIEHWRESG